MADIVEKTATVAGGLQKIEIALDELLSVNANLFPNPFWFVSVRERIREGINDIKAARERARLKKEG